MWRTKGLRYDVVDVIDTRTWDPATGRPEPGTGDPEPCDICEKSIVIHVHVIDKRTGKRLLIGTDCAKKAALPASLLSAPRRTREDKLDDEVVRALDHAGYSENDAKRLVYGASTYRRGEPPPLAEYLADRLLSVRYAKLVPRLRDFYDRAAVLIEETWDRQGRTAPRKGNPLPLLAGFASLVMATPVTPLLAAGAAARRKKNPSLRMIPRGRSKGSPNFDGEGLMKRKNLAAIVKEAATLLGVDPMGRAYGCGQYGCAAPTTDGRVVKVTVDPDEIRWAWAVYDAEEFRGFARIDTPPKRLWKLDYGRYAYGYVREDVTPIKKNEIGKTKKERAALDELLLDIQHLAQHATIQLTNYLTVPQEGEDARRRDYIALVQKLAPALPDIAASLLSLAARGALTYDIQPSNMGRRSASIVLFDGRVTPPWLLSVAAQTAWEEEAMEGHLRDDETKPAYLPKFAEHVKGGGGFEPELRRRVELTHYRYRMTDADWPRVYALAKELRRDPDRIYRGLP